MSPVCVAAEKRKPKLSIGSMSQGRSVSSYDSEDEEDDSSGGSGGYVRENSGALTQCSCAFRSPQNGSYARLASNHEDTDDCVFRGTRGPGNWHCYVAIINRNETTIRIDGRQERMTSRGCEVTFPVLDGLTIGSDHNFEMSLCFGQGSDGEGEGAIAELAVFKGQLPLRDIERLEQHVMTRHGIAQVPPGAELFFAEEDEGKRQARALIAQTPPYKIEGMGVPLRIVARDPAVAWHRANLVTGELVSVGRIGSRLSTGSSDW
eukprot:CAMPEP_0116548914 /NCGR_PEP_ID=MMETSP0397-20121206/4595_1 /TAXON_ID=216820 /ORGANISM="Cyclophora tenuis, Strain ECT3854" /LENGTH=262 /DNA_ID=CAMNT_0004073605 /DNA_START=252 /DNA_END=1040 /DNA_ORIENTATION=-